MEPGLTKLTRLLAGLALVALSLLLFSPAASAQESSGGGAESGGAGSSESSSGSEGSGSEGGGSAEEESGGGSFLVSPGLGLMIWTLVLFLFTMWVLSKFAFPKIGEALEKRASAVRENIEQSEKQRAEADELLAEYRARLREAREQADDIAARARKSAEAAVAQATADGRAKRDELVNAARKDIETETRRSLEQIRREVADLTVLATEKITRKSLTSEDHQKLVEDALAEVDFSTLAPNGSGEES